MLRKQRPVCTSEAIILDIRKATILSGAGAIWWYLCYPNEGLKSKEALKKEPKKTGAVDFGPHEGNAPKKMKSEPS